MKELGTDARTRRYENAEVALNTGMILREMLRHEPLARTLLYSDRYVSTKFRRHPGVRC